MDLITALQLPIPTTCPDGFKLLIKQCWSNKAKNRPSFKIILAHLEIAGNELLTNSNDSYSEKQKTWQTEIRDKLQSNITTTRTSEQVFCLKFLFLVRIFVEHLKLQDLIKKRQEEIQHARDVRLIYEKKLEKTNQLYVDLYACFAQLEEREREITEREKLIGPNKPYRKAISQIRKQHFEKIARRRMTSEFSQVARNYNPNNSLKNSMYVQLDGNSEIKTYVSITYVLLFKPKFS